MAQLMRQRERVAQRPGIVHQHIRMHAEHTARERAGLLAVVLIHVDPAFGERAVQQLLVFLAQRGSVAFLTNSFASSNAMG